MSKPRKKSKVTITEIARRAQVSPSAVSLVINGKGRIGEEARKRVMAVVKELNYSPRAAGRGRKVSLGGVALVCPISPDMADRQHGYGAWVMAAQSQLMQFGSRPQLFVGASSIDQDVLFMNYLKSGSIKGMILFGTKDDDGYIQAALDSGLPMVVAHRLPKHREFSYVTIDDAQATTEVADLLLSHGHRTFAIAHHPHQLPWNLWRRSAMKAAVTKAGCKVSEYPVDPLGADEEYDRMVKRARQAGVTAIFATNDYLGIRVVNALHRAKIALPDECSVFGFDHSDLQSDKGLRLSSVAIDDLELGKTCARILRNLMNPHPRVLFEGVVLDLQVVEHETSGPAPSIPARRRKSS